MPKITFQNKKNINFDYPISILEIAKYVSVNLYNNCIAGKINNSLIVDASELIYNDSGISIITNKDSLSLNIIRRSTSNLMAIAIKKLYPKSIIIKKYQKNNNFYCEIISKNKLSNQDCYVIEQKMLEISNKKYFILKHKILNNKDILFIKKYSDKYKLFNYKNNNFLIDKKNIYFYKKYITISNNPQVSNIFFCNFFRIKKITIISKNIKYNSKKFLLKLKGISFNNKKKLNFYLKNKKKNIIRDHRIIGKNLDLYHFQEQAPGMIFWHNNGLIIFKELEQFIREKLLYYNYQEVKTPLLMDKTIWEKTGHWDNYSEYIFTTYSENRKYCIKPMNCPGHIQIFNQNIKSYRDLPIRMSEFGSCHRNEPSGALHGLMRVRAFTQDDAHIFCTTDQIYTEINSCIKMIYNIYSYFKFKQIQVKLSTRPIKRIGNDYIWDKSEKDLKNVLNNNKISYFILDGEGAFYGPKIEFSLLDSLGRIWQCGTIQLDFALPKILNSFYIDKNNEHRTPVMIHRAILGSIERFIGILTEEYLGLYPTWLSPIQVVLINITERHINYIINISKIFIKYNIRFKMDLRNETVGLKIRENILKKIPYIIICGDEEIKNNSITIRTNNNNSSIKNINLYTFIRNILKEIKNRSITY